MNPFRNIVRTLSAALFALGVIAVTPSAQAASEGPYRMEVLINGRPAPEYWHQSTTYIEAKKGREYSVRLTNTTGERVAVALTVDGLNSIDAKHTSAAAARKWILGPYESIVVSGWQTSSATARQFYFTRESSSYGAWLGDTRNLGNISTAWFREERPVPPPYYQQYRDYEYDEAEPLSRNERAKAPSGSAGAAAKSESARADMPAPSASLNGTGTASKSRRMAAEAAPSDDLAATGIGRERYNQVYTVEFHQESSPAAVMTVRYEYREKLIEMGILPRPYRPDPMSRRETSSGFTDYGYAPDPYGRR